jgi:signal transduction histidine kinase
MILDITQIENQYLKMHKEHFNLNELVQDRFHIQSNSKREQISYKIEIVSYEENLNIFVDENRINQVNTIFK